MLVEEKIQIVKIVFENRVERSTRVELCLFLSIVPRARNFYVLISQQAAPAPYEHNGVVFNADDPQWAVNAAEFPADKEHTWGHREEDDGWKLAHDSIRGELDDFQEALEALVERHNAGHDNVTPLEFWEVGSIKKWFDGHEKHIVSHHKNEEELIVPFLKTRFNVPASVNDDHRGLEEHMEKLKALLARFEKSLNKT